MHFKNIKIYLLPFFIKHDMILLLILYEYNFKSIKHNKATAKLKWL